MRQSRNEGEASSTDIHCKLMAGKKESSTSALQISILFASPRNNMTLTEERITGAVIADNMVADTPSTTTSSAEQHSVSATSYQEDYEVAQQQFDPSTKASPENTKKARVGSHATVAGAIMSHLSQVVYGSPKNMVDDGTNDTGTGRQSGNLFAASEKEEEEPREEESCECDQSDDQRETGDNENYKESSSFGPTSPLCRMVQQTEHVPNKDADYLQEIVALFLIDPGLVDLTKCNHEPEGESNGILNNTTSSTLDRYSTETWAEDGKPVILCQRRAATARTILSNLADLLLLKRRYLQQMEQELQQDGEEVVQYVQYGIITKRISAIIEIGEDGSCCSRPLSIVPAVEAPAENQEQEVDKPTLSPIGQQIRQSSLGGDAVGMNHTISDVTCESSFVRTTSSSSTISTAAAAASTLSKVRKFQEHKNEQDFKDEEDTVSLSLPYSMSTIAQIKEEATALMSREGSDSQCKPTCNADTKTTDKYARPSEALALHLPSGRVQFAETIVTEVRERPLIDPEVRRDLFYTYSDILRFEDEYDAEEGYYQSYSESFSTTFSYQDSELEQDENVELTPVPAEPPKGGGYIGEDFVDDLANSLHEYKDILNKAVHEHFSTLNIIRAERRGVEANEV